MKYLTTIFLVLLLLTYFVVTFEHTMILVK